MQEFVNHRLLRKDTIVKRQYQLNLLAACSRENSLMVLPTGLGKTIVALLLSVLKLDKIPSQKVIFLAPTKPLVDQHYRFFSNVMTLEQNQLICITGSIVANKRDLLYNEAKILFMTPQVLQNDIIKGVISLKEVSLIIFDECHRAVGNYAYVFIAEEFVKQNPSGLMLGMTASPGKNKEKIEEILSNLHLTNVEIKTEQDADVKPFIQARKEKWIDVELPEQLLRVINTLDKMMKEILKEFIKFGYLESGKENSPISKTILFQITKELDIKINTTKDQNSLSELFYLKKLSTNAVRISHMMDLLEAQGIGPLLDYFEKNIKEIEDRKATKSALELFGAPEMQEIYRCLKDLQENNISHPKMKVLKDLLEVQLLNHPNSRILVFAHFRDTVSAILEYIVDKELIDENQNLLIRPERFVGQAKKGDEAGLSQKQQLEVLKKFKSGEINILVATSVAEEGLDIDECDLVIFFDIVPSEIRAIQRRGRTGRKKEGSIIMLKSAGTKEDTFYFIEKRREQQMKKILMEIKSSKRKTQDEKIKIDLFKNTQSNSGLNRFINSKKSQEKIQENSSNPDEQKLNMLNTIINTNERLENKTKEQSAENQFNGIYDLEENIEDISIDENLDAIDFESEKERSTYIEGLNGDEVQTEIEYEEPEDIENFLNGLDERTEHFDQTTDQIQKEIIPSNKEEIVSKSNQNRKNLLVDLNSDSNNNISAPFDPLTTKQLFELNNQRGKVTILIDNRELRSDLVLSLRNKECDLRFDNYFSGDYIISTRCAIERKSIADFVSSLKDARLFDEIIKLKDSFEIPILLIEGSFSDISGINQNAFFGALSAIILKFNISVLSSANSVQSADMIFALAKKEQIDEGKSVPVKVPKLPESDRAKIELILCSFPKLNITKAKELLNKFGTLQNIFNASEKDLMEIPGIGKITAQEIVRISRMNYLHLPKA